MRRREFECWSTQSGGEWREGVCGAWSGGGRRWVGEGEREAAEVGRETCTGDQNVRVTGMVANILGMTEYRYIAAAEVYSTGGDIVS